MRCLRKLAAFVLLVGASAILGCGTKKEVLRQPSWSQDLHDIAFADTQNGWVVGSGGLILVTQDSGETWTEQPSGVTADLMSVAFPNPKDGWTAGQHSVVLRTQDGGQHWHGQRVGDVWYTAIAFPDANRGWLASEVRLTHTPDAGKNWFSQADGFEFPLFGVHFLTPREGWASGAYGRVVHTDDSGKTWTGWGEGLTWQELRAVFFISPELGWAAGTDGELHYTGDGGKFLAGAGYQNPNETRFSP